MTELNDAMVEAGAAKLFCHGQYIGDAYTARSITKDILTAALAFQPEAERAKIIEECAKVADAELQLAKAGGVATGQIGASSRIAAAIRALGLSATPPAEGGQKG